MPGHVRPTLSASGWLRSWPDLARHLSPPVAPSRTTMEYADAMTSCVPSPSRSATAGDEYQPVSHHEEKHPPFCHFSTGALTAAVAPATPPLPIQPIQPDRRHAAATEVDRNVLTILPPNWKTILKWTGMTNCGTTTTASRQPDEPLIPDLPVTCPFPGGPFGTSE